MSKSLRQVFLIVLIVATTLVFSAMSVAGSEAPAPVTLSEVFEVKNGNYTLPVQVVREASFTYGATLANGSQTIIWSNGTRAFLPPSTSAPRQEEFVSLKNGVYRLENISIYLNSDCVGLRTCSNGKCCGGLWFGDNHIWLLNGNFSYEQRYSMCAHEVKHFELNSYNESEVEAARLADASAGVKVRVCEELLRLAAK